MDARRSPVHASRRPWAIRPWTLVVFGLLLVAGTLIQACSDNNGTTGPTFECAQQKGGVKVIAECTGTPAPSTGFANTAGDIRVQVLVNPASITPGQRAGVTAVATNLNGQPLAGKKVQFSTDVGSLDVVSGTTNSSGQFSTTLRISETDAANAQGKTQAIVTAFVEGASGQGIVTFGANAVLVLIPETTTQSVAATVDTSVPVDGTGDLCPAGSLGGFTVTFTVSGGVPPYVFSTAGVLGSISSGGVYTVPIIGGGPFASAFAVQDVVTVVDSTGNTDTSTVRSECVKS